MIWRIADVEGADVLSAGESLPRTHDDQLAPRIICAGWACRHLTLKDGRRQILGFLVTGDSVGMAPLDRALNRTPAQALTTLHLAKTSTDAIAHSPDETQLVAQIVRLGRQTAYERIIHMLLELHDRLEAVGLTEEGAFDFPLTQEIVADATGLSIVHVNRVLQRLRQEMLVERHRGRVILLNLPRLRASCDYTPASAARFAR